MRLSARLMLGHFVETGEAYAVRLWWQTCFGAFYTKLHIDLSLEIEAVEPSNLLCIVA